LILASSNNNVVKPTLFTKQESTKYMRRFNGIRNHDRFPRTAVYKLTYWTP